jgi:hypothetical protein
VEGRRTKGGKVGERRFDCGIIRGVSLKVGEQKGGCERKEERRGV